MSDQKKPIPVLDRLESLERLTMETRQALDGLAMEVKSAFQTKADFLEALVEVMKDSDAALQEKLQEKVVKLRNDKILKNEEQEERQLKAMIEADVLQQASSIVENCLIIARLTKPDGTVDGTGRLSLDFGRLTDKAKTDLLGKEIGFVYETEGRKLEILDIFVQKKVEQVAPEEKK